VNDIKTTAKPCSDRFHLKILRPEGREVRQPSSERRTTDIRYHPARTTDWLDSGTLELFAINNRGTNDQTPNPDHREPETRSYKRCNKKKKKILAGEKRFRLTYEIHKRIRRKKEKNRRLKKTSPVSRASKVKQTRQRSLVLAKKIA